MTVKTKSFDIAEHLLTDKDICSFLEEVIKTGDDSDFIHALGICTRAKGMTEVANKAGVSRASLYKSLAKGANPKFETVSKITKVLGLHLTVQPMDNNTGKKNDHHC